jgi:adenosine deaminase
MISHLHLHLEPEERKRASLGLGRLEYRSREQFFYAHRLERGDRPAVARPDLAAFLAEVHEEQRAQSVDYVELRLSPRRFIADGMTWCEFLQLSHAVLSGLANPVIRAILLVNRDSPQPLIDEFHERVEQGLPPSFVGLDLAGDELRFPNAAAFLPVFESARVGGLGVTVHAGEFGGEQSIWQALDELGASRIGHGLAASASAALLERLRRDLILVETSLGSNVALGAVASLQTHPARMLFEHDIPVCFNADVPLHTGRSFSDEIVMAAELLGLSGAEVLGIQAQATQFGFMRSCG